MKRHKRDLTNRAYNRGYQAGINGKSKTVCPFESGSKRQQWMVGWRSGRIDNWDGYVGVSGIHRANLV